MQTLEELIASKLGKREAPPDEDSDLFPLTTIEPSPEILYHDPNKYPEPSSDLFIACWTPFLKDPFSFNVTIFRDYKRWLLSPSLYVLNSFPRIDSQYLFELFQEENPPKSIHDCYTLSQLLWEIDLTVPDKYLKVFIDIIKRKNSP